MESFFVSSTFKDMQGERDVLHRLVMPRLREEARSYGEGVQLVDLRWGISTTELDNEAGAGRILQVCLDEIRQCEPYMVVLLGQRYGWMPPVELLTQSAREAQYLLEPQQISVTELEIRYGMWLAQGKLDRCVFCLREPIGQEHLPPEQRKVYLADSPEDQQRMDLLRQRILQTPGVRVLTYRLEYDPQRDCLTGYDAFADQLTDLLRQVLQPAWQARQGRCWQQRQRDEDRVLEEMHLRSFVGREEELALLQKEIRSHQVVLIQGEGGSGKSALMAKLGASLDHATVYFCGNSASCMSAMQLIRLMKWALGPEPGDEELPDHELRTAFYQEMAGLQEERIFLIDAIDQLVEDQGLFESWFLPPQLGPNCHFVISTTGAVRVNPLALPTGTGGAYTHLLQQPRQEDLRRILEARLRAEHKQLSPMVAEAFLKNPCCGNMLGMEVMIRRLLMMSRKDFETIAQMEAKLDVILGKGGNGERALDDYLATRVRAMGDDMNQLVSRYIQHVGAFLEADRSGTFITPLLIMGTLQHGCSAQELAQINDFIRTRMVIKREDSILRDFWDPISFATMKRYLGDLLLQRKDGRVDFSHRLLRESVRQVEGMEYVAWVLREWLRDKPMDQETKLENVLILARITEERAMAGEIGLEIRQKDLEDLFCTPIIRVGNLESHKDPQKAVEGKRQMEVLTRSILADLSGPDGKKHLAVYLRILDKVIAAGAGPNHYVVWFFGTRVVGVLEQQGEDGQLQALQILMLILSSMGRRAWEAQENRALGKPEKWDVADDRYFLLYHTRCLRLLGQLQVGLSQGRIKAPDFYGLQLNQIVSNAFRLSMECIRQEPENWVCQARRAMALTFAATNMEAGNVGLKTPTQYKWFEAAVGYCEKTVELAQASGREKALTSACSQMAYTVGSGVQNMLRVYNSQIFGTRRLLERTLELCQRSWHFLEQRINLERLRPDDYLRLVNAWGDCLYRCALEYKKRRQEYEQQAVDLRWDCYYKLRQDPDRKFGIEDREQLAVLAAGICSQVLGGTIPTAQQFQGGRRYVLRFLVEREGAYIHAQARTDFESRWRWGLILCVEAAYYHLQEPEKCLAACSRGLPVLQQLEQEVRENPIEIRIPQNWVHSKVNLLLQLQSKNGT